jgi:catechol 2,3-dioxygenase-like lactoylglutathione lyase family enzyme
VALTGIDRVTFGVEDLAVARRFLEDWGLTDVGSREGALVFETRDGTEVAVRHHADPVLPAGMEPGATLREVTWGVTQDSDLELIAARLKGWPRVAQQAGVSAADPNGLMHTFRVSQRRGVVVNPQDVNGPGAVRRVDQRAPVHSQARPVSVGHVVLFVSDLQAMIDFFVGRLQFTISDTYPKHATFLRARTPGPHHDLFILSRPGRPGLNHVAFTVGDIHEVFGGGLAMSRNGWETEIGPGRHPISSAYFWYFRSPFGGALEYYTDDDWCTEAWQPREFERKPELFAEWAIAGGIDGNTRRQARGA